MLLQRFGYLPCIWYLQRFGISLPFYLLCPTSCVIVFCSYFPHLAKEETEVLAKLGDLPKCPQIEWWNCDSPIHLGFIPVDTLKILNSAVSQDIVILNHGQLIHFSFLPTFPPFSIHHSPSAYVSHSVMTDSL